MSVASRKIRIARAVMSSRLPIGVATTKSVPAIEKSWLLYHWPICMIASEPLPHFIDDLLEYLYEAHPTSATLDGVHTHDDLLEDFSRQTIESESHALARYLRRLDEIRVDGRTDTERPEHT